MNKKGICTIVGYIHDTDYDCDELEVGVNEYGDYILCHYDGQQSIPLDYPAVPKKEVDSKLLRERLDKLSVAQCFQYKKRLSMLECEDGYLKEDFLWIQKNI